MKKICIMAISLLVGNTLAAQTITVNNKSGILLSDVIFTIRDGNEVTVSFYGEKTINIPQEAVKFKIVSPAAYRNMSTNKHNEQIITDDVPIMTFDDITIRVTYDGPYYQAGAHLQVEEIDIFK